MKFYRYGIRIYASYSLDMDGEMVPTRPILNIPDARLQLEEYNLYRETPKGYWICTGSFNPLIYTKFKDVRGDVKWVSKTSRKRFAHPTKEEALKSFIIRNKRRMQILEYQMNACEIGIREAEKLLKQENL